MRRGIGCCGAKKRGGGGFDVCGLSLYWPSLYHCHHNYYSYSSPLPLTGHFPFLSTFLVSLGGCGAGIAVATGGGSDRPSAAADDDDDDVGGGGGGGGGNAIGDEVVLPGTIGMRAAASDGGLPISIYYRASY